LAATYPAADSGMFNIGVLHTSLQEEGQHATYAPCSVTMLADKQYDYWALGHIHHRGSHQPAGASPIVFSGNTQGRNIRETGPKGCFLVDSSGTREPQLVFKPLDSVRWELLTVHVGESDNLDDVQAAVQSQLRSCFHPLHEHSPEHILVVRIRLEGTTKFHGELVQHQRKLAADIQALAIDLAGGAIWIESLRVRTTFPHRLLDNLDDAALRTVMELMNALGEKSWHSPFIDDAISSLNRKLPDEIPSFELGSLIEEARAELFGRLRGISQAPHSNGHDGKR
jgi:DNA repair exonuclease SbcCD nuclease subunit